MTGAKFLWDQIYHAKSADQMSWTEANPSPSYEWILDAAPERSSKILDVGGGTSLFVDLLLEAGYQMPALMDISPEALSQAQARVGARCSEIEWIESSVLEFRTLPRFSLWHDRAVFHFLTDEQDREKYFEVLRQALLPKAKVIVATFSTSGPEKCSGLNVMRYDETTLPAQLDRRFETVRLERKIHKTPWSTEQEFIYGLFSAI
jgi:SAM-dependent methyltransferase